MRKATYPTPLTCDPSCYFFFQKSKDKGNNLIYNRALFFKPFNGVAYKHNQSDNITPLDFICNETENKVDNKTLTCCLMNCSV